MPEFFCDLSAKGWPLPHFWEQCVGSGHAPLALRADYQAQLQRCHEELGFQYVRFHGLLSGNMQTLFVHQDELFYSFFNVDRIFDFLLSIGMRPFVELSFMPAALASGTKTVFNYAGPVSPPRDYDQWGELIERLVRHCVDRYGRDEVRQWFFEVWNEPNLKAFWTGKQADYFKLYRAAAERIKKIDPEIKVGGPATAQNAWIEEFLDFCQKEGVAADFVTTHHYPTDAFGSPGDDTVTQLSKSERSILRHQAADAKRRAGDLPLYYTEWNSSSNPRDDLHDHAYSAAFATKTIMEAAGLVEGYSFWTFSDIFEENYFPSAPFHGGFGLLNVYGIPKPVYRAYELLHGLGDEQLLVDGLHHTVDAWAARDGQSVTVLLTNHALPGHPLKTERVTLRLRHAERPRRVAMARIDADHASPYGAWVGLGRPAYLSHEQVGHLEEASRLVWEPLAYEYEAGEVCLSLEMLPQSVAAVTVSQG